MLHSPRSRRNGHPSPCQFATLRRLSCHGGRTFRGQGAGGGRIPTVLRWYASPGLNVDPHAVELRVLSRGLRGTRRYSPPAPPNHAQTPGYPRRTSPLSGHMPAPITARRQPALGLPTFPWPHGIPIGASTRSTGSPWMRAWPQELSLGQRSTWCLAHSGFILGSPLPSTCLLRLDVQGPFTIPSPAGAFLGAGMAKASSTLVEGASAAEVTRKPTRRKGRVGERSDRAPTRRSEAESTTRLYGLMSVVVGAPFTTVPGAVLYTASTLKSY